MLHSIVADREPDKHGSATNRPMPQTLQLILVLLGCALAYTLLTLALLATHGRDSKLAQAIGNDAKGKLSLAIYVVAFASAFVVPWVAVALFVTVAVLWFIPDRRIERVIADL